MKKFRLATISLMLSIILWGTLLGGIAYSHLVYFPVYLSALPDSAVVVNGPYGLHEETFWLLIHPLLILSLVVSLALNWKIRARRKLLGITMTLYGLAIVATIFYFVPELLAFKNSPKSCRFARGMVCARTALAEIELAAWSRNVFGYGAALASTRHSP